MADLTKIKLPDNSEYNLKDHRIPGVDTTPTSGSNNVITSGGVYNAVKEIEHFYFVQGSSSQAGNASSGSYLSTKWEGTIIGITTPTDGLKIAYRIATNTGVGTAGAVLSIDGGTTYYPVVYNVNTSITSRYSVGSTILMTFNSTQKANGYLTSNTKTSITGCWQIMDYDANTNTYQREYISSDNVEYPITTRYNTTSGDSYYAEYGRYSEGVTLNPSTNTITASKFKVTNGTSSQFLKADGSTDSNTYALASNIHDVEYINVGNIDVSGASSLPSGTFADVLAAYNSGKYVIIRTGDSNYVNDYFLEFAYMESGNEDFVFTSFYVNTSFTLYSNDSIYSTYGIIPDEYTVSDWGFTKNIGTLTGVKFNNTDATISNGVASITASIPSAPGTLNTTATTAQSTSASEALSGSITLHKVAKTGTYSDLIGTPTIPGGNAKIFYGTCNSQSDYINKSVVCPDFTSADLVKGALIFVTFDYTNNVDEEDVKLNVNNTGSVYIREPRGESNSVSHLRYKNILQANCTYLFTYNGTYWVLLSGDSDKDTTYSIIDSTEAQTGTSTTSRLVSAASLKRDIEYRMAQNQADWNITDASSAAYIKNKPTIPSVPVTDVTVGGTSVLSNGTAIIPAIPDGLPSVTSSDNGKVLQVSNGDWAVANVPSGGDTNVIETVKVNSTALTPDANKAVDVTVPIEVINLGTDPVSAPSGTFAKCQTAISAGRTVALRVVDSEDNEVYYYYLHSTGTQYAGNWQGLYFSRVAGNYIFYYSLGINDSLTYSVKSIGTLTGVKFNNVDATVSNGVASITATIPEGLPAVSSSDNGKVLTVVSGDWAAATAASGGVSDVTLGGTSVVSSGTAVLPAYPTVPTNVSSFTNDANYVKYVLCADEAAYNAISNKDSGTLYLIPKT